METAASTEETPKYVFGGDDEATPDDSAAIEEVVGTAGTALQTAIGKVTEGFKFADLTDETVTAAQIASQKTKAANEVVDAQSNIDDFNNAAAKVEGLTAALNAYHQALTAQEAADDTFNSPKGAAVGALAGFEAQNANFFVGEDSDILFSSDADADAASDDVDKDNILNKGKLDDGEKLSDVVGIWVTEDSTAQDANNTKKIAELENGVFVATTDGESFGGINTLLTALNNLLAVEKALVKANDDVEYYVNDNDGIFGVTLNNEKNIFKDKLVNLTKAELEALGVESGGSLDDSKTGADIYDTMYDSTSGLDKALTDAQDNEQGILDAEAVWEALKGHAATAKGLEDAVTAIEDALVEAGYQKPVELSNSPATATATANDDIYFISNLKKNDKATITNFGEEGSDFLFVGKGYSLVLLGEEQNIDALGMGDANKLEVFVKQTDTETSIYIETHAAGGTLTDSSEIIEVKLTGVTNENALSIDLNEGVIALA